MLTPQEIQMANQATGNNVPLDGTPATAPVQSRADQIRALGKAATPSAPVAPKLGQGAMGDFAGNAVRSIAEPLLNIGGGIQKIITGGQAKDTGVETAVASKEQHAGGVAGTLGDIVGTIAPYFTGAGEAKAGTALAEKVAPFISGLAEHLGMTTESLLPKIASYVAKNAPEVATNTAIGTAQTGSPAEGLAIGAGGLAAKEALGAIPKLLPKTPTIDEVIGQVAQGTKGDVPSFTKGLSSIDTKGVTTYSDLQKSAQTKIAEIAKQQDAELAKDATNYKVQQLATPIKTGETTTYHNYVNDALQQLKDFYTKTNDVQKLTKVDGLMARLDPMKGEGLTVKDVNDIARMHGADLSGYNKNGELASGLTKQAAENTRSGLKDTVQNLMPDTSRALDKQLTDLYTVRDLSANMSKKVTTLSQRLQQPNILQKLGGYIGRGLKFTGVGDMARALLGMEKIPGAQTLNAVELEARLSKNLKRIESAMSKDDAGFLKDIQGIIQEPVANSAVQPSAERINTQNMK